MKQLELNKKAGLYLRLSKDDLKADGDKSKSLSIEHQREILTSFANEHDWEIIGEYVDDGVSGTTFNRPGIQHLLEDAKNGRIDVIVVKDLSRFGRNYIEVGQYVDYIFPMYGIRFIAISDNIDTANRNSGAMEMMPIMNVFNEWHAANTSKKIKAVIEASARAGKYRAKHAPYGYVKGTGDKMLPVIDEPAASVVRRIFEMRASGKTLWEIATTMNDEKIQIPADYLEEKFGIRHYTSNVHFWTDSIVYNILKNQEYTGTLVRLKTTTISYKNKKKMEREPVIIPNAFEGIISQELWDKVKEVEKATATGKKTSWGITMPLSGMLYCADCGGKMKLARKDYTTREHPEGVRLFFYVCGKHARYGKYHCYSHNTLWRDIESVVLNDLKEHAKAIALDEKKAREEFLRKKEQLSESKSSENKKALALKQERHTELERLIQAAYEDKVMGKIPEELCLKLLEKYTQEQKTLKPEIEALQKALSVNEQNKADVDEFIRRIKQYDQIPELTRELCLSLIDRVTIGAIPNDPTRAREIHIYYKFLNQNI